VGLKLCNVWFLKFIVRNQILEKITSGVFAAEEENRWAKLTG
jgi:hypothetical protein